MGKFRCDCGEMISTSNGIPNPAEWLLVADATVPDSAWDGTVLWPEIYEKATRAYKCPSCARLFVYWDGLDATWTQYDPAHPQGGLGSATTTE